MTSRLRRILAQAASIALVATAITSASLAVASDPVPYPDIGSGGGDPKTEPKGKIGKGEVTDASGGTQKELPVGGSKTSYPTGGGPPVKVEGKKMPRLGNGPLNNRP